MVTSRAAALPRPVLVAQPRRAGDLLATGAVVCLAVAAAAALDHSLALGVLVAVLPAVPLLLSHPRLAGLLGVALLPFTADVLGNGPVRISLSDAFLALALLGTAAIATRKEWQAIRPVARFVAVYGAALVVAVAAHLDAGAIVNSVQRLQILIVPMVVGALTLRREHLQRALSAYVVTAAVLGLAFSADLLPAALAFQKNPVGQYVGGALLVVVMFPGRRWRLAAVPLLGYGLFQTGSRGAILGLLLGIIVLLFAGVGAKRLRTAALLVPVVAVLGAVFFVSPDDVQRRTTTISSERTGTGAETHGEYTIRIRQAYRNDALHIIRAEPLTGLGIGNYRSGATTDGTVTNDPHNVVLLEAAEGGLPLLGGFLILIAGTSVLLWQRRRDTPLAVLALAVQASTVGHGCVDIYWVRGTPVLGWLLVGAALADAHRRRTAW